MARYIDAYKLEKDLPQSVPKHNVIINGNEYPVFLVDHILHKVRNYPTADVVEVKRGHWKHSESPLGWQDVDVAVCSVCGEEWVLDEWDIKEFSQWNNYCPNCGADMRGDKSDNL